MNVDINVKLKCYPFKRFSNCMQPKCTRIAIVGSHTEWYPAVYTRMSLFTFCKKNWCFNIIDHDNKDWDKVVVNCTWYSDLTRFNKIAT